MIPHEDTVEDRYSNQHEWSEGVADLIPDKHKLKVISQATKWSEGVADLIPHEHKLKVKSQSTK